MKRHTLVTCVGISPLYLNIPNGHAIAVDKRRLSALQEAELKLYRDAEGRIALPCDLIIEALDRAWAAQQCITKHVSFLTQSVPIHSATSAAEAPWQSGILLDDGTDGKPIAISLPRFDTWAFTLPIAYDEGVKLSLLIEIFERAGRAFGIGYNSPHDGGGSSGRFRVSKWEETSQQSDT